MLEELTLAKSGVDLQAGIDAFERELGEPLASELPEEDLELARRRRIAEENDAARERMIGILGMPRARGRE